MGEGWFSRQNDPRAHCGERAHSSDPEESAQRDSEALQYSPAAATAAATAHAARITASPSPHAAQRQISIR
jgi:hypothetical protein